MLRELKNNDNLEIENVICFYVGKNLELHTMDELKKIKRDDWSYQDYLVEACDKRKFKLIWLCKDTVSFTFNDRIISINDDTTNTHISLSPKNRHNTVIFQGQANDDMNANYEGLMRAFEYLRFFMLNTVDEIKIASDKFMSANLLSSKGIPQPKYCLVTKELLENTDGNHDSTRESFWTMLDSIYNNNVSIDEDQEIKYVCKILGGSLGIGVFLCNRNEIESILQTMFEIDEDAKFIIQEFKKNTGDIRVHLLSVDGTNYEVLACMKRNKIAKDFRSNVSLGATTDQYKLSEEQEEIVMKTAMLSGCRWVGVDLMECEDGSNVVIEYNSSPGVQGISEQIKKNMFEIVFEKIEKTFKNYLGKSQEEKEKEHSRNIIYSCFEPEIVENLKKEWDNLSQNRKKVLEKCLEIQPGMHYELHKKDSPEDGMDCSGYVYWIIKQTLNKKMPQLCARYFTQFSTDDHERINEEDLQPGDIGVKHEITPHNHCGIYAGDGKWFECSFRYGFQLTDCDQFKHFFRVKGIDDNE